MTHKYYVHIQVSGQQDYRSKYHKQAINKLKKSKILFRFYTTVQRPP